MASLALMYWGDSHFSYIKSQTLSISYNDTQSAQNGSNHTVLVDHYIAINVINHPKGINPLLTCRFIQYYYKMKLELANTNISFSKQLYMLL